VLAILADMNVTKPRVLTPIEVCGGMSHWYEQYACWLSEQKSYQNMTERARFGRIKAMRALNAKLDKMLPFLTAAERQRIADDINQTAKLKAGRYSWHPKH